MSNYEKQNFVSGQILKAEHLNHMEDGIGQLSEEIIATNDIIGLDSKYLKTVSIYPDVDIIKTSGMVLASGSFASAVNYDSVMYMPVEPESGTPISVFCTINGTTALVFYDGDKNVLLGINGDNCADYGVTADIGPKRREITPPDGTKYIGYSISTSYGDNIMTEPVEYKVFDYSRGLLRRTANLEAVNMATVIKTVPDASYLRTGGFITAAGNFVSSESYEAIYMLPLMANPGSNVRLFATIHTYQSIAFYDDSKNIVGYINGTNCADYGITIDIAPKEYSVPVPSGAKYISYAIFKAYGDNILDHQIVSEINANSFTREIADTVSLVGPKFTDVRQMKTLIIGDSISTDSNSTGINYGNYKKWVGNLIDTDFLAYGNVTNDSIHATGFVARLSDTEDDSFLARIKAIPNPSEYDLVIVFGGINDSIQGIPFGGDGDTDTATYFKPAVNEFFEYLTENFINARIAVLLPLRTYSYPYSANADHRQYEYGEYIAEVAKQYALPVLDLTNASGFRPHIASYRARWTLIPEGYEGSDGVHPNAEYCKDYLAPMIRDFLSSIL